MGQGYSKVTSDLDDQADHVNPQQPCLVDKSQDLMGQNVTIKTGKKWIFHEELTRLHQIKNKFGESELRSRLIQPFEEDYFDPSEQRSRWRRPWRMQGVKQSERFRKDFVGEEAKQLIDHRFKMFQPSNRAIDIHS